MIQKNIEPDTAEDVLKVLKRLDGTIITTHLTDKLPGGRVEWRIIRQAGWTELRNRHYSSTGGEHREGVCLTVARGVGAVPLSADFVERENPNYFAGRRERNALRRQALNDHALLQRLADIMNTVEEANRQRAKAREQFSRFVAKGAPCSPCQYELERACGLRDEK